MQPGRNRHLTGPAQRDPCLLLCLDLGRAFRAYGKMLGGAQIGVHPQFAVHVCGDSLARQMLGGTETRLTTTGSTEVVTHSVLTFPNRHC